MGDGACKRTRCADCGADFSGASQDRAALGRRRAGFALPRGKAPSPERRRARIERAARTAMAAVGAALALATFLWLIPSMGGTGGSIRGGELTAMIAYIPAAPAIEEAAARAASQSAAPAEESAMGTRENPVPVGQPFSFVAQVYADGTMRTEATNDAYFDLPVTVTLTRSLLPDYYAKAHSSQYWMRGNEAGAELDIALGAAEGLESVSMQDAILVMYETGDGQTVEGYKFTDAEIGGETRSVIETGARATIYKRYKYDEAVDLRYLTLTYFYDAQSTTVYFSLEASGESYAIGSTGDGVKQLQQKLIDLGYLSGTPDGKFGEWTALAVKAAQRDFGLAETGIADPAFLEILYGK